MSSVTVYLVWLLVQCHTLLSTARGQRVGRSCHVRYRSDSVDVVVSYLKLWLADQPMCMCVPWVSRICPILYS